MKQHTIIFVPHVRAKFRKWRLSTLQITVVLGSVAFLTLASLVAIVSYFSRTIDREQLARLQAENEALRETNEGFGANVRDLEERVEDYQERIRRLTIVAGLSEPSLGEAGIGGSGPWQGGAAEDGVGELRSMLDDMAGAMDRVERQFDRRELLISRKPAIAPVKGLLTSGFGYRRDPFHGRRTYHHGIDITAPYGKPIRATGSGIVTSAGWHTGLGKSVSISHGFGIVTRYGHMSEILVKSGATVRRGDVIGRVGDSGRSTGVHLHYEVHVDGKADNPLGYILDGTSAR